MLEFTICLQSEQIRTIIKARGISYPNVTGKTFAVFRVDRKHHLMSLVSMIGKANFYKGDIKFVLKIVE